MRAKLLKTCAIGLLIAGSTSQGQQPRTVDLTSPLPGPVKTVAEIVKEALDFSRGALITPGRPPLPSEEQTFPLELRLESLPAFDKDWSTMVEVRMLNTGVKTIFLPLSTERKTLYANPEDDKNREYVGWGVRFRSASSVETFMGLFTFRSSTDPQEALELRPNEPVLVRFKITLLGGDSAARWIESMRRREEVQAAVEIQRFVLRDFQAPDKGLRYQPYVIDPLFSNYVRIPPQ